jgi:hypothetical protein
VAADDDDGRDELLGFDLYEASLDVLDGKIV